MSRNNGRPRSHAYAPWLLFAVLVPLYFFTGAASASGDVYGAHYASWKVATTGQFAIEDHEFLPNHPLRSSWVTDVDDEQVIARSAGVIASSVPLYWLSQPEAFVMWPGNLTAAVLTATAMALLFSCLLRQVPLPVAAIGTFTVALATPVWSIAADGVWTHSVTVLGIAGTAWAASSGRWWLVGLFGGLALAGRPHMALLPAIMGLGLGWSRRQPLITLKVALLSAVGLGLTSLWNWWMIGSLSPFGNYSPPTPDEAAERYPNLWLNEAGQFFAMERGILGWSPALVLLLPALVRTWRTLPEWSRVLIYSGAAYMLVQGYGSIYHGGDAFWGYRRGIEFVVCLAPALVLSAQAMGRWARILIGPAIALQTVMIGTGAILDAPGNHQDAPWWHHSWAVLALHVPVVALALTVMAMTVGLICARTYARRWPTPADSASGPITAET